MRLLSPAFASAFVLLAFALFALLGLNASAQSRLVSEEVYEGLVKSEELLEAKDTTSALNILQSLMKKHSVDDYERAVVTETLGVIYSHRGDHDKARASFEEVLKNQQLSEDDLRRVRNNLAQIYILQEDYRSAIRLLEKSLSSREEIDYDAAFIVASAYASLSEYRTALQRMNKIVASTTIDDLPVGHLALTASLHLLVEDYPSAVRFLKILVVREPDNVGYWRQLVSAYLESDSEDAAFAAMQMAYVRGMLNQESDIKQLARFYLRRDLPYKAAILLRDEIKSGGLKEAPEIDELLALAWSQAREHEEAIPFLEKAARSEDSGKHWLNLAHIYMEQEKWTLSLKSVNAALGKGKLKNPERVYLLKGIIQVQLERYEDAEEMFLRCLKFENTRKQAIEWLEFIGSRVALETEN